MKKTVEEVIRDHPEMYRKIQDTIAGALVRLLTKGYVVIRDSDMKVLSDSEISELISTMFRIDQIDFHDLSTKYEKDTDTD